MKIAIGSDHRGFALKHFLQTDFPDKTISFVDVGCNSNERCDYPDFTKLVVKKIQEGQADLGVLLCATGVGMSIAANRFEGIYAGLAWNEKVAKLNKEHDNVNILVLPADFISEQQAIAMITVWLKSKFARGRYLKRIEKINAFGGL